MNREASDFSPGSHHFFLLLLSWLFPLWVLGVLLLMAAPNYLFCGGECWATELEVALARRGGWWMERRSLTRRVAYALTGNDIGEDGAADVVRIAFLTLAVLQILKGVI